MILANRRKENKHFGITRKNCGSRGFPNLKLRLLSMDVSMNGAPPFANLPMF